MNTELRLFFVIVICFLRLSLAQEYDKVNGVWNATFLDFPISEKIYSRSITLPLHTQLTIKEVDYISRELKSALRQLG